MRSKIHELWILVVAERRKAGVLALLLGVLGVLVGKHLLQAGPREASGSEAGTSENVMGEAGVRAITLDELRLDVPVIELAAPEPVDRNVFVFIERYYPEPAQSAPSSEVQPKSDAEAVETPRDAARARAEQTAREVREEAAALRLKSTLMGPNPMAVIERGARHGTSQTLRIGDMIEGFTLISVENARVVLEKRGVRVELRR